MRSYLSLVQTDNNVQEELRMRYHILELLMCRPILYYLAHESVETSSEHDRESSEGSNTPQNSRSFWIHDACYRTLQCAALLILDNETDISRNISRRRDWFEIHMSVPCPRKTQDLAKNRIFNLR